MTLSLLIAATMAADVRTSSRHESAAGRTLIEKMRKSVRAASPVIGTAVHHDPESGDSVATFKAMWPGLLSLTSYSLEKGRRTPQMEFHWTGKEFYIYLVPSKGLIKSVRQQNPMMPAELFLIGFEPAFSNMEIYTDVKNPRQRSFRGHNVYEVETITPEQSGGIITTLYIDRKTYLPVGYSQHFPKEKGASVFEYQNVQTHAKLKAGDFAWHPPKDAKGSGSAQ